MVFCSQHKLKMGFHYIIFLIYQRPPDGNFASSPEPFSFYTVSGTGQSRITCIILGSVSTPSFGTMWPRYDMQSLKNLHLLGLSFKPAVLNLCNTARSLSICSSGVLEKKNYIIKINNAPVQVHFSKTTLH